MHRYIHAVCNHALEFGERCPRKGREGKGMDCMGLGRAIQIRSLDRGWWDADADADVRG